MKRNGIDFFPFPSTNNTALRLLEAEFKLKGVAIYVKLLQKIFAEEGYFYKVTDDVVLLLKQEFNLATTDRTIQVLIQKCVERDIFDKKMFENFQILTSEEIQKEYLNAVRKRKHLNLIEEYLMPFAKKFLKMAEETQKTAEESEEMAEENSKGKESKGKNLTSNLVKEGELLTTTIQENENQHQTPSDAEKINLFNLKTGKYVKDINVLPIDVDIELLIDKVNKSTFLKNANNFTLKVCLEKYDKIIAGVYDDDVRPEPRAQITTRHAPGTNNAPGTFARTYSTTDYSNLLTDAKKV